LRPESAVRVIHASTIKASGARSSKGVTRQCRASHTQVASFAASSTPTMTKMGTTAAAKMDQCVYFGPPL
jgi:hypothetical protein